VPPKLGAGRRPTLAASHALQAEAAASKFPPALTSQPGDVWLLASAGPPAPPGGGLQARPNVRDSSAGSGASGSISSGLQRLQLQALDGEAAASSSGMLPPGGAAGGGGGEGVQPAGRAAAPPEPPPVPAALASQPLPRLGQPDIWSPLMELGTRLAELLRSGGDPALPQQQALLGAAEAAGGAAAAPGGAAPAPCSAAAGYLCGWAADCSGLDAQVHGVAFDAQQLQQLLAGDAPSAAGEATVQATEVPCLVRLRAWPCAAAAPQLPLQRAAAALELHGVVLCSALGVSVSPCGRRLACCLATRAPALGGGDGGAGQATAPAPAGGAGSTGQQQGPNGTPQQQPGPQQLPEPPPPLLFELRVLSLLPGEEGQVLGARALSAPHCLTSVQFSPAGGHILLAFGRRHASLAGFVMAGAGSRAASMTAVQRVVEVRGGVGSWGLEGGGGLVEVRGARARDGGAAGGEGAGCAGSWGLVEWAGAAATHSCLAWRPLRPLSSWAGTRQRHMLLQGRPSPAPPRPRACALHSQPLQVYRADTLQLVRALCSAADEINAAAWHPTPGWGFAYGTKDGRVRLVASGQDPWAGRVPSVAAGPDPWAGWARAVAARGAAAGVAQGAAGAGAAEEGAVGGVAGAMAVGLAAEAEAEAEAEAGLQAAAAGAAEAGAVGPAPSAPPDTAASAAEQPTVGSESEGSAYIGAGVAGELGMRAAVQRTQFGATHD